MRPKYLNSNFDAIPENGDTLYGEGSDTLNPYGQLFNPVSNDDGNTGGVVLPNKSLADTGREMYLINSANEDLEWKISPMSTTLVTTAYDRHAVVMTLRNDTVDVAENYNANWFDANDLDTESINTTMPIVFSTSMPPVLYMKVLDIHLYDNVNKLLHESTTIAKSKLVVTQTTTISSLDTTRHTVLSNAFSTYGLLNKIDIETNAHFSIDKGNDTSGHPIGAVVVNLPVNIHLEYVPNTRKFTITVEVFNLDKIPSKSESSSYVGLKVIPQAIPIHKEY